MGSLTIHDIDETTHGKLQARARAHGRSIESEVLDILRRSLEEQGSAGINLADSIRARVAPFGGGDIPEVPRAPSRTTQDRDP